MKEAVLCLCVFLAIVSFGAVFQDLAGCKAVDRLGNIENISDEDLALTEANVSVVTRALVAVAVSEAHVKPEVFTGVAAAIELAANSPGAIYTDTLIVDLMTGVGLTNDEATALWVLVGQQIKFDLGVPQMPLGTKARHLMLAFAKAIRDGAQGRVTQEDKAHAATLTEQD